MLVADRNDLCHVTDERKSLPAILLNELKKVETNGDNHDKTTTKECLDKVAECKVFEVPKGEPSKKVKERLRVVDENLSLEKSCLDQLELRKKNRIPIDYFNTEECRSFETSKHRVDFSKGSNDLFTRTSPPVKEIVSNLRGCDVNATLEEMKRRKSSSSGSMRKSPDRSISYASEEQRKPRNTGVHIPDTKRQKMKRFPHHSQNGVEHVDFSCTTDKEVSTELKCGSVPGRPELFPEILHKILDHSEADGYSSIISWLPHGRAFKIHNASLFIERVMPKYFYQTKISSFRRQLRIYGFHKLRNGVDKDAYYHELFLRGRLGLCIGIAREKPGRKVVTKEEPNFYKMPPLNSSLLSSENTQVDESHKNSEPRTILYTNTHNGNKPGEIVDATSMLQPDSLVPASISATPCPLPLSASKTIAPHKRLAKSSNIKPTPIKIIRNGKPLTKNDIKSGGFRILTSFPDKHLEAAQVLSSLKQSLSSEKLSNT